MLIILPVSAATSTATVCTLSGFDEIIMGGSSIDVPEEEVMFSGDGRGRLAVFVSLVTNISATALIAYRTWYVPPSVTQV